MSEPAAPEDIAARAAEDQALASARHAAHCAARWWQALHEPREGEPGPDLPPGLARWSYKVWWEWFITTEYSGELDDDDDDEDV